MGHAWASQSPRKCPALRPSRHTWLRVGFSSYQARSSWRPGLHLTRLWPTCALDPTVLTGCPPGSQWELYQPAGAASLSFLETGDTLWLPTKLVLEAAV